LVIEIWATRVWFGTMLGAEIELRRAVVEPGLTGARNPERMTPAPTIARASPTATNPVRTGVGERLGTYRLPLDRCTGGHYGAASPIYTGVEVP